MWRVVVSGSLLLGTLPATVAAQSDGPTGNGTATGAGPGAGGGGGALSPGAVASAFIDAFKTFLRSLFTPITKLLDTHGSAVIRVIVGTPHPNRVFGRPGNLPWGSLYSYYWHDLVPIALLLFGLAVGLVIVLETTSHLFSGFHRAKLKRRALVGLLGILSWWWINAFALQIADGLTLAIVPRLSTLSLFETASFAAIGLLGVVASLSVDLLLFALVALVYFVRQLVLHLYVLLMPLLIVLWIPGVGPFGLLSRFATRLASFYVPFLFMTLPVALLFRLGQLLGESATLSLGGFGAWLTAIVVPIIAVLAPVVLVWQTGRIVTVASRTARHVSLSQARTRTGRVREVGARAPTVVGLRGGHRDAEPGASTGAGGGASRRRRAGRDVRRALTRVRRVGDGRADDPSSPDYERHEPVSFDDESTDATTTNEHDR